VKDSHHARSWWARLDVRVPRDKTLGSPFFMRFFEQFPSSFPMLRQLLGL